MWCESQHVRVKGIPRNMEKLFGNHHKCDVSHPHLELCVLVCMCVQWDHRWDFLSTYFPGPCQRLPRYVHAWQCRSFLLHNRRPPETHQKWSPQDFQTHTDADTHTHTHRSLRRMYTHKYTPLSHNFTSTPCPQKRSCRHTDTFVGLISLSKRKTVFLALRAKPGSENTRELYWRPFN